MEVTRLERGNHLELRLAGRFDAAWADFVSGAIDAAIKSGMHHIALNFAGVVHLGSPGLRVILEHRQALETVSGRLWIIEPTATTLAVIQAAGLAPLLLAAGTAPAASDAASASRGTRAVETAHARYEVYAEAPGARVTCTFRGRPAALNKGGYAEADCRPLETPAGTLAVGLGAFGENFADCQDRFGEFLAAGGAAITLPTAEERVPDVVVGEGALVPRVQALYAITTSGPLATMVRFDAPDPRGVIGLSRLVTDALSIADTDTAALVVLAEATAVVGAALRRSPARGGRGIEPAPLSFPTVRDWLTFTGERTPEPHLVLIVGLAARRPTHDAMPFLRPLRPGGDIAAHLHGAVFAYRPVRRGYVKMDDAIHDLLAAAMPRTVLHLLTDTRSFDSVGETDLLRGACWIGSVTSIARESHPA